jgi:hypothetical protein
MAAFFSVVRFVPDSVANEAVNIGVLVASGDRVEVRPLSDWDRVRHFAGAGWREARRLVEELHENPKAFLGVERIETAEDLRAALSGWTRALQFSEVRASLDTPDALMESLEPLVLVGQGVELPQSRRAVVARTIYRAMSSAFELRFERRARGLVKKHALVSGQRTRHKIDVGVVNGSLYAGAFALTFSTDQVDRQWKDTDAVAFAVEDLSAVGAGVPLGVVLDEPAGSTEASHRAFALLRRMNVETMPVQQVSDWARRAMNAVPDTLLEPG